MTKTQAAGSGEKDDAEVSTSNAMHLTDQDQLPAKVANVSREEIRKFMHCKRVGNYLLGKTVGEGSFAKVKEAFHILTGEKVAIKIIDKNRARKDRYVSKNMRREARLLQMIRHPHIVQLLEIVETSQCYYLVFEFADGGDLMDYICKHKKLKEEEVRKFVRQILCAVEYLHRLGIIHRDLKVENLLLDAKKNIKIIDFGLSNTIYSPDTTNENHCSTQCGSPAYAAPELLVRKDYGSQIDVWSIGVNLYAMLTGRLPYTVEPFNISTLYNKMLRRQMNVVPDNLSEDCKDFIHQLLNPNPKERINIQESTKHRWITNNQQDPLMLTTLPNYLTEEDLEEHILDHVESQLELNSDEIIRDVIQNRATKNSCVYHLLVRRLERYKRDYEGIIHLTPPTKATTTEELGVPPCVQQYAQSSTKCNSVPSARDSGLLRDQMSAPKVHIEETPFKITQIALIRQKNATNRTGKSKAATAKKAASSSSTAISPNDAAQKHKLCQIKRVALVKVSPARRSLRAMTSGSRSSISNPMASRRGKNNFEVPQRRRKAPKVRRRYAEPDDSLSSIGSASRHNVHARKPPARRRSEKKSNHEVTSHDKKSSKPVANGSVGSARPGEELREKSSKQVTSPRRKEPEEKSLETVTHFYTDKGVVLKRDPSDKTGNTDRKLDATADHDVVQHHIFHSQESMRNSVDKQEPTGCNDEHRKKITAEQGEPDVHVVNVKIASTAAGRGVEKLKPISPRLKSSSTPASKQNTRVKDPLAERASPLQRKPEERRPEERRPEERRPEERGPEERGPEERRPEERKPEERRPEERRPEERKPEERRPEERRPEEKSVTPQRSPTSSKIPVAAGKQSPCHQPSPTPVRRTPKAPSHSTAGASQSLRTTAKKAEVRTLVDKYTKCFSVVVVNRPSAANEVGCGSKAGVKDKDKVAAGNESREEEKNSDTQTQRDKQNLQRKQADNKSEEIQTQSAEKHQPQSSSKDASTLTTKNSTTNISRTLPPTERKLPTTERKLPTTVRTLPATERKLPTTERKLSTTVRTLPATERKLPTTERKLSTTVRTLPTTERKLPTPVREFIAQQSTQTKQAAPWVADERRKISSYRKTSDSTQIKTTIPREMRTASTNYRSMLRPCSIK